MMYCNYLRFLLTGGEKMIELFGKERTVIEPLCAGREEKVTLYACVEGHMGRIWVDDKEKPVCAIVFIR